MKFTPRKLLLTVLIAISTAACAQNIERVHGTYSYTVGENENITLAEVKRRCIIGAQNAAIKETFKEKITSITNMTDANINGKDVSSFYDEVTLNSCAEWVGDTREPAITATYANGALTFEAEVWGEAREVTKAKTEFEWRTLCNGTTNAYESSTFKHGDRLYIKFKSPVSGYLAIYLLDSSSKTATRMLPYAKNTTGYHEIKAGKDYLLFDPFTDPEASPLTTSTSEELEMDQVILIFSPNFFARNNDEGATRKQLARQSLEHFEQWLKKLRKRDSDIVIDRTKWITIVNDNINK